MFKFYNPNPKGRRVGDCTVRALTAALELTWHEAYDLMCRKGAEVCDMPSANAVWGETLRERGMVREVIPDLCPDCYGGKPIATETRYSTAPPPQAGNGGTITYEGDSDFAQAVQGKPTDAILPIIDEIMEAVRALTPRLYNAAIDKLRDLP